MVQGGGKKGNFRVCGLLTDRQVSSTVLNVHQIQASGRPWQSGLPGAVRQPASTWPGKEKPHRGDRDGAWVWRREGAHLLVLQIQAHGLDSQRAPLVDQ